jgi:hypothetical protein
MFSIERAHSINRPKPRSLSWRRTAKIFGANFYHNLILKIMKRLEIEQMEVVSGGSQGDMWKTYAGSCAAVGAALSFTAAVPALFGASAIYLATCGLLLPIAGASGYL